MSMTAYGRRQQRMSNNNEDQWITGRWGEDLWQAVYVWWENEGEAGGWGQTDMTTRRTYWQCIKQTLKRMGK